MNRISPFDKAIICTEDSRIYFIRGMALSGYRTICLIECERDLWYLLFRPFVMTRSWQRPIVKPKPYDQIINSMFLAALKGNL